MIKSISNIIFLLFFVMFAFPSGIFGQKKGEFILLGTVLENEVMKLEDVTISVFETNEKIFETITSKKGKFELALAMNNDYVVEFSKAGYVTKSISVNTEPPKTCTIRQWSDDIGTEVSLFKYMTGVNYSMYKSPFAYFEFNEKCSFRKNEIFEKTVSAIKNKVRDDVTKAQKEIAKSSEAEDKLKEEQEKKKQADEKFKQLIGFADEEFKDKNYQSALQIYSEALKIKPGQLYPETQIINIQSLLAEKQKSIEKQKQSDEAVLAKKTEPGETKSEPDLPKEQEKLAEAKRDSEKEDLKKTEKKSEALLHRLSDLPPFKEANAELEKQMEIEKGNDLKSTIAHTAAKRIFLEEIADSKMRLKQQYSAERMQ